MPLYNFEVIEITCATSYILTYGAETQKQRNKEEKIRS